MSLEAYVNQAQDEYISVLDFVNALYKHARPQVSLKNILEYVGNNYSFIGLALYQKKGFNYISIKPTSLSKYGSSIRVIESLYECLDDTQVGIIYSDEAMKPFKEFYFKSSDVSKFYEYVVRNPSKIEAIGPRQSKAPPPPNHIKTVSTFKQRTIGDLIKAKQHESAILPNDCQRLTMLYDYFTPHQAGCLIAGLHPAFNGSDDDLEVALGVIEGGIKKGGLLLDDDGQLNSDDLKSFLHNKDWVMVGFNDNLASDTSSLDKNNPVYQKLVIELEKKLEGAKAEIAKLKNELKERPTARDDDLKDVPHQAKRTVIRVMYAMAKLTELDNSNPYSQNARTLNEKITTILQNDGLKLEYQAVGKWLKEINEVQSAKK
ncbi:hypothetical protein ACTXLJ_04555 [Psychrobacter celer]|uniref:hypothetical protein n=1 Tax=Psychrobacter celer TaxID=306572 RepID=UPI003FD1F106